MKDENVLTPTMEQVVKVNVKVTVKGSGVDVDVHSDDSAPAMATALFLGLMATYGIEEAGAKEVFDVMIDKIAELKGDEEE